MAHPIRAEKSDDCQEALKSDLTTKPTAILCLRLFCFVLISELAKSAGAPLYTVWEEQIKPSTVFPSVCVWERVCVCSFILVMSNKQDASLTGEKHNF